MMLLATHTQQASPLGAILMLGGSAIFFILWRYVFAAMGCASAGWDSIVSRFPDSQAPQTGCDYKKLTGTIECTRFDLGFNIQICESGLRVFLRDSTVAIFIPWGDISTIRTFESQYLCRTCYELVFKEVNNFSIQLPIGAYEQMEEHLVGIPREEQKG